ncbi:MAG TPA: 3-phosphoshikimate 1-carboxyvinyltransferase [Polyangiaceae bacterium]|jgi:3-phosphoshikimate 1-carboxyvinyltransferase|nr:3-phosphoshikimate 1-carboxyvinyltransferase [Polyangiaceae bacterium]
MASAPVSIVPLTSPPDCSVRVPGSKSYTNRALIAAALGRGHSVLSGALFSDDTHYMQGALDTLGVRVTSDLAKHEFEVDGAGGQIPERDVELFVGNAGTAARFLTVLVSLGSGNTRMDGTARMRERPMADLVTALRSLGVSITEHGKPGCFPMTINGQNRIRGPVSVSLPGNASSQFISGLVLSAPCFGADVEVKVVGDLVSKPYLDMTAAVMASFGVELEYADYTRFFLRAGQAYTGRSYAIEPDASAASYFFAAAAITGGRVTVEGLGTTTKQGDWGLVDVLERMGAKVLREPTRTTVIGTGKLVGVEVDMKDLSDVAQTLAVVAPFASSPTTINGIGFIRHKETDRVGAVVKELGRLGIRAEEHADGYTVHPGLPSAGLVHTYDDHRMAMSFALLGLKAPGISIDDPACTSKTFPNYFDVLAQLHAK